MQRVWVCIHIVVLYRNYAMIQPKLFVYDAIYNPRETQLLKEARLRGAETSNGGHATLSRRCCF